MILSILADDFKSGNVILCRYSTSPIDLKVMFPDFTQHNMKIIFIIKQLSEFNWYATSEGNLRFIDNLKYKILI